MLKIKRIVWGIIIVATILLIGFSMLTSILSFRENCYKICEQKGATWATGTFFGIHCLCIMPNGDIKVGW